MIVLALVLVAAGAVLLLVGASTDELGWLIASIWVTLAALIALAAGVLQARRRNRRRPPDEWLPGDAPGGGRGDAGPA